MDSRFGISPQGVALWPHVNSPDTKFGANGIYSVKLKTPTPEALGLVEAIDERIKTSYDAAVERAASPEKAERIFQAAPPYSVCDNGEAYVFAFKLKASGVNRGGKRYKAKPTVWDFKGNPIRKQVGHGSLIRVSFEYEAYHTSLVGAGVTLKLLAVQVIKLVQTPAPDASVFGFVNEDVPRAFGRPNQPDLSLTQ